MSITSTARAAFAGDNRDAIVFGLDLACEASAIGAAILLRRRTPSIELAEGAAFLLAGLITLNASTTACVFDDPRELFYLALVLLGIGTVVVRRGPALVVVLLMCVDAIVIAWLVGQRVGDPDAVMWAALTMSSSATIAVAVYAGRRSSYTAIVALQRADRERNLELEVALKKLETELAERQRLEADRASARERERALADQLRHVQKLDAVGTLAGGIAHDINNVLAAILGAAELGMEDHSPDSSAHEEFGQIVTAALRGSALTRNLLGFARRGKHRHERVVVMHVIDEVLALLARTAPRQIRFVRAEAGGVAAAAVMGDPGQLSHVIMNLCLNSVDAITGEGTITITVGACLVGEGARATLPAGPYVQIDVRDTGAGMCAETLEHAFERRRGAAAAGSASRWCTERSAITKVRSRSAANRAPGRPRPSISRPWATPRRRRRASRRPASRGLRSRACPPPLRPDRCW